MVPSLAGFLLNNAGFTSLRQRKELESIEARFDPTVTPTGRGDEARTKDSDLHALREMCQGAAQSGFHTIVDFYKEYSEGVLTPTDVVNALLPVIRRDLLSDLTPHSTAFIDSKVELIRRAAEKSTIRWKKGKALGILDGVPFAVKDELDVKGYKRYNGTKNDYTKGAEVESSWCVSRLERAGAIMIGKTNMHELGMGTCPDRSGRIGVDKNQM